MPSRAACTSSGRADDEARKRACASTKAEIRESEGGGAKGGFRWKRVKRPLIDSKSSYRLPCGSWRRSGENFQQAKTEGGEVRRSGRTRQNSIGKTNRAGEREIRKRQGHAVGLLDHQRLERLSGQYGRGRRIVWILLLASASEYQRALATPKMGLLCRRAAMPRSKTIGRQQRSCATLPSDRYVSAQELRWQLLHLGDDLIQHRGPFRELPRRRC